MTLAFPKPQAPIVSPAVRKSAIGQRCACRWSVWCADATVVLAHVRGTWAGIGQKPSDIHAVYACQACHDEMDGRAGERPPARDVLRAMIETQSRMLASGLISVKGSR